MSHVDDVGSIASGPCRNSRDPDFPNPQGGTVHAPETNTKMCCKVHCDSPKKKIIVCVNGRISYQCTSLQLLCKQHQKVSIVTQTHYVM